MMATGSGAERARRVGRTAPPFAAELPHPVVIVSPHLDDAVLSAGNLLAALSHVTVLTIFAGSPPVSSTLTTWDRDCGFAVGEDVIGSRREEDRHALSMFDASPLWLDFLEEQYATDVRPTIEEVSAAIVETV